MQTKCFLLFRDSSRKLELKEEEHQTLLHIHYLVVAIQEASRFNEVMPKIIVALFIIVIIASIVFK